MLKIRLKTVNLLIFSILIVIVTYGLFYDFNNVQQQQELKSELLKNFSKLKQRPSNPNCRDYHDYKFMEYEKTRNGPGEQGQSVELTDKDEIERNKELYEKTGFNVLVSDKISVNRSVPDVRPTICQKFKYLKNLPKVTIIIIFHNEVLSILKRTIHSVINRTPPELLYEIILVNDASVNEELYEPFQSYVAENFPPKIKILNLKERHGLIRTRLEGAKVAKGEILIFFDSHMEVNANWLPPLIEPIVKNRRIATLPVVDSFDNEDFKFYKDSGIDPHGDRAVFDWKLVYKTFPRYLPESVEKHKPYPTPIMLGCAFAIDRKFFMEELGGYDEGFEIWNAENYELSFKLWLCADGVIVVPCSHVTHTFRKINPSRKMNYDFEGKNFKRLAEVWMDEYKEIVYNQNRDRYDKINPGDLTKAKAVKDRLTCKPFSYFLDKIAPEIIENFPTDPIKQSFARGRIRLYVQNDVCLDTFGLFFDYGNVSIYQCQENEENGGKPTKTQEFRLTFTKNIISPEYSFCLDSHRISMRECNNVPFGNQIWKYDHEKHLIIQGGGFDDSGYGRCISMEFDSQKLDLKKCDVDDVTQLWKFDHENLEALKNWDKIYGYERPEDFSKIISREKLWPLEYEFCDEIN